MTTIDDAARAAMVLPRVEETTSFRHRAWAVAGAKFAWERPFTQADVRRFGDDPVPAGPILAVVVEDLGEKEAVLAERPAECFTIPHLDGFAAVLVRLEATDPSVLRELLVNAWFAKAPPALAREHRDLLG